MKALLALAFLWVAVINGALAVERNMVPYLDYSAFTPTHKTLRVTDLVAGTTEHEEYNIDKEAFDKAIILTLNKSKVFERINKNGSSDYELQYELKTARLGEGAYFGTFDTVVLFVRYVLVEAKTKRVVWKENILSQKTSKGQKMRKANRAAARDNLGKLMKGLSEALIAEAKT